METKRQRFGRAAPATSPQRQARAEELRRVLELRGPDRVDRAAMAMELRVAGRPSALERLARSPYGRASGPYILTHDRYLMQVARRLDARHVDDDDVLQAGRIGALRALDRFDASRLSSGSVTAFLSYARWWVLCEVGRLLEDEQLIRLPSTTRKAVGDLRKIGVVLADDRGVDPESLTDAELATASGLRPGRIAELRSAYLGHDHRRVDTISSSTGEEDDEVDPAVARALQERQTVEASTSSDRLRQVDLAAAVTRLPTSQRIAVEAELAGAAPDVSVAGDARRRAALGRLRCDLVAAEDARS